MEKNPDLEDVASEYNDRAMPSVMNKETPFLLNPQTPIETLLKSHKVP